MIDEESGWVKRNITDKNRMEETIELYKSLGFEVRTEAFDPAEYPAECSECMNESPEQFIVIYTKSDTKSGEGIFDE
jgi:hypothetical protein